MTQDGCRRQQAILLAAEELFADATGVPLAPVGHYYGLKPTCSMPCSGTGTTRLKSA